MIVGGIETLVGVVQEPVFGPVVVFGLGGTATGLLADHAARLAPLTDADAEDLIRAIRAAPTLLEHAPDTGALRDTLLRVSRLADDLPQVAELDLNPVIVRADGVIAVDARIRVTSEHLADPFLRLALAVTAGWPAGSGHNSPGVTGRGVRDTRSVRDHLIFPAERGGLSRPGPAGARSGGWAWRLAPHTRMSLAASARMSLPGTAPKWSSGMRL